MQHPRGAAQEVEMEHARKMALVDQRLVDTLRSPPPPTDTLGKKVHALDDKMMCILDGKDLDNRTKITLCNQVLQRYNVFSNKHVKEPVRVVAVNESMPAAAGAEVTEGEVGAPSSGIEADVVETVPKTMQAKTRRLMEHLKRDIGLTTRGELIHEGVPIAGSNVVDLMNDLLRKRNTDPTGWQPFAQQLRAINLPMELVGNVAMRDCMHQAAIASRPAAAGAAVTPRTADGSARRSLSWTPLARWRSPHPRIDARLWRRWLIRKTFMAVLYVSIAQCTLR